MRGPWLLLLLGVLPALALASLPPSQTWALIVSGSRYWFNYRHSANALSMYAILKEAGVPDNRIILGLSEDHSTKLNNPYFGTVYVSDKENPLLPPRGASSSVQQQELKARHNLYRPQDTEVDLVASELTASTILGIISGRERYGSASSQRFHLSTAEDGELDEGTSYHRHLLIYLTGHGGDGFLKLSDKEEITSVDLAQAVAVALRAKRFHSVTALFDTCQAATLHEHWYTPGILAFSSSVREQNSYAYGIDDQPTSSSFSTTANHYALQDEERKEGEDLITVEDVASNYKIVNRRRYFPGGLGQSVSDGFTRLLWEHLSSSGNTVSSFSAGVSTAVGASLPWRSAGVSAGKEQRRKPLSARELLLRRRPQRDRRSSGKKVRSSSTAEQLQNRTVAAVSLSPPPTSSHHHHHHSLSDVLQAVPGWRIGSTVTEHTATVGTGALEDYFRLSLETHGALHPAHDGETAQHTHQHQHQHRHLKRLIDHARQLALSLIHARGASSKPSGDDYDPCGAFWRNEKRFKEKHLRPASAAEHGAASITTLYLQSLLQCEQGPPSPSANGFFDAVLPRVASASYLSRCRDDRVALAACLHRSLDSKLSSPRSASSSLSKAARGEVLSSSSRSQDKAKSAGTNGALPASVGKALLHMTAAEHIFGDSAEAASE